MHNGNGNTRNGDGCSSTCALEGGFSCMVVTADLPATLDLPIIIRDFTHLIEGALRVTAGTPAEIRDNPQVIEAYLGGRHAGTSH